MELEEALEELPYEVIKSKVLNAKGEPLVYLIPKLEPYVCGFDLRRKDIEDVC